MSKPKNILVVDGDPLIRWAVRQYLDKLGYQVTEAEDGTGARVRFNGGVDAVLLDIRLPDEDGISLYRDFKQRRPEVPVLIMSAHSHRSEGIESLTFLKPLRLDELSRALHEVLITRSSG